MATAIKRRTLFQRGGDVIEFIDRPDIVGSKAYRVILNGTAVDWAYDVKKSADVASFYFRKHIDGTR
jgi:hypothetical protein